MYVPGCTDILFNFILNEFTLCICSYCYYWHLCCLGIGKYDTLGTEKLTVDH